MEVVFDQIKTNRPLTHFTMKSWHQLMTRHQETVTGLRVEGGRVIRVQVTFERKGVCKLHSNNPKRFDGIVHEYCPPEHVQSEMDRLLDYHRDIDKKHISTHVEAAWLHHRFVRTHPFEDGPDLRSPFTSSTIRNELPLAAIQPAGKIHQAALVDGMVFLGANASIRSCQPG